MRISAGSTQLFVGPASSCLAEQIYVRSSTRATSSGSERAKNEFLRLAGFRRLNTPAFTNSSQSASYSAWEPSHQRIASGFVSAATSATHSIKRLFLTYAGAFTLIWSLVVVVIRSPGMN